MSWYDPRDWSAEGIAKTIVSPFTKFGPGAKLWDAATADPGADAEKTRKEQLYGQAGAAGRFADQTQGSFGQLGLQGQANIGGLQRIASGQDSVSAEQLRQALGRNQAAQMSMAAGAAPQNAASAARTAAIQMGRQGMGLAGQQAVAGLAERNAAQSQLTGAIQGMRGQDLQATQGARGQAIQGYGANNAGTPEKSWIEKYGPVAQGIASYAAMSDRRLKTEIKDGDESANRMLKGLKAFSYRYKDDKHGAGARTGIMAQDLERAGIGHAVIETPEGKAVHGAHLATANTAMLAALQRRLAKVEGTRK